MTAQSPSAYFSSALLHAAIAALLFLLGYALSQNQTAPPQVFELVAGTGDNYAATEAPAVGSPDAPAIKMTAPPVTAPTPEPVAPVAEAVPVPAPAKVPPKPAAKPAPTLLKTLQQRVRRAEARVESRIRKKEAADEKRQQMSLAEFQKEHPDKASPLGRGIAGGVVGGSVNNTKGGAGGKALTREQGSEMDAYYALLRQRLLENHQQPADVSTSLTVQVEFHLASNGAISGLRIIRSSGSEEFDQSVKEAFARTHAILPPSFFKGDTVELTFALDENTAN